MNLVSGAMNGSSSSKDGGNAVNDVGGEMIRTVQGR